MNAIGIAISLIYIFVIIGIATFLPIKKNEIRRNIVHIGVCNWWIIASVFFDNVFIACMVPALFVIVNYISYRYTLFTAMERKEKDLGTVYYAISCLLLTIVSFGILNHPFYGGVGLLIMGYGDGFANVFGSHVHSKEYYVFGNKKSILGTITMFLVSCLVVAILSSIYGTFHLGAILIVGFCAAFIENITPYKMDNLTVPLISMLLAYFLF